jgi:hypothetical protein
VRDDVACASAEGWKLAREDTVIGERNARSGLKKARPGREENALTGSDARCMGFERLSEKPVCLGNNPWLSETPGETSEGTSPASSPGSRFVPEREGSCDFLGGEPLRGTQEEGEGRRRPQERRSRVAGGIAPKPPPAGVYSFTIRMCRRGGATRTHTDSHGQTRTDTDEHG